MIETNPLVAIITGSFSIVSVILTAVLTRTVSKNKRILSAVREQVENGHHSNMREESDSRHADNSNKLDLIIRQQRVMRGAITTNNRNIKATNNLVNILATRVTTLTETSLTHGNQIANIEHTIPKPSVRKPTRKKTI